MLSVLIIAYARSEKIEKMLKLFSEMRNIKVYVSIDGPKNSEIKYRQEELRKILKEYETKLSINLLWGEQNLGIKNGVINAVDWFFSQEDFGVILEDDLEFDSDFFSYVLENKKYLYGDSDILMICGSRFAPNSSQHSCTSTYPIIWGWATNSNKWNEMRQLIFKPKKIQFKDIFDYKMQFWFSGAYKAIHGDIDTWDLPLAFEMYRSKKKSIIPPINLITNTGFDEYSNHTLENKFPLNLARSSLNRHNYRLIDTLETDSFMETQVFKIKRKHVLLSLKMFLTFGMQIFQFNANECD